jgi:hypothetical protein
MIYLKKQGLSMASHFRIDLTKNSHLDPSTKQGHVKPQPGLQPKKHHGCVEPFPPMTTHRPHAR